ncbi:hypothetical protein SAMN04488029_2092 [Reichenbachiella faecimaris]|uniref:Uncharacterized protein n=2 Tax=Reichenbachiella faecimaris TaxID=692418 RepID=A0A1W2GEB5_REIFA|nr:hypothetical protein SAMN04488029_2092 [Reichenbachiella faecimaris]
MLWMSTVLNSGAAHNSKMATFTLRDTGAGWLVEMNFAQAGVDAAMIEHYGKSKILGIEKKAYQDLVINYVKSNFHLTVDGREIALRNGGILIGSHQTDLKFILPEIPLQPSEAKVYIPMFGTTYNHTNLFRVYRGGKNITKFFLNEDNDFEANLIFTSRGVFQQDQKPQEGQLLMLGSGGLFFGLVLVIVFFSRKKLKA